MSEGISQPDAPVVRAENPRGDRPDLFSKFDSLIKQREDLLASGVEDPFSLVMEKVLSPTRAVCNGRDTILLGTYNYMGMTFDPDVIEALPFKLGERPPAGAAVVVMLAEGAPYARVYVPQPVRSQIKAGMAAQVHVDGFAEPFSGEVRFISADAAFTPYYALTQKDRSRLSYLTEVVLTEPRAAALPTGITVEVGFPALSSALR